MLLTNPCQSSEAPKQLFQFSFALNSSGCCAGECVVLIHAVPRNRLLSMSHLEGITSSTCSVDPATRFEMTQSSKPDAKNLCPNNQGSTNRDYLTLARGYERKTRKHYKSAMKHFLTIAVGTKARGAVRSTSWSVNQDDINTVDNEETPTDEILAANGVSFTDIPQGNPNTVYVEDEESHDNNCGKSISGGSKRSSEEKSNLFRRTNIMYQKEALNKMLTKQIETAEALKQMLCEHTPISIHACLQKLDAFEDISDEAIIAVHEAIKDSNDKKAALLSWDGPRLRKWIEYIVATHPHFHSRSPWK